MTARRRSVPPSRRRYDDAHPTVAARVDRETLQRLKRLGVESGESTSGLFLQGLGLLERDLTGALETGRSRGREEGRREGRSLGLADGRRAGYAEGRKAGYAEAAAEYRVRYACAVCGTLIELRADRASAEAAAEALTSAGWGHAACVRPRG